jgi:soluble lytic murein transglycosylase-like protein
MQLIPATARRFGVSNAFDPGANLDGGVRYLKYLMNLYGGDLKLSLAAYNAGENAVADHNGIPPYRETQDYLRKISEIYPLTTMTQQHSNTGIDKYVDNNGIVHFSNVDQP